MPPTTPTTKRQAESNLDMSDVPLDLPRAPVGPPTVQDLRDYHANPSPENEQKALALLKRCGPMTLRTPNGAGPNHHFRINPEGGIDSIPVAAMRRYGVAESE